MTKKIQDQHIPEQYSGAESNTITTLNLESEDQAISVYKIARSRLLNVNKWHEYAGSPSAEFTLTDHEGTKQEREPREGDYFKISIPGPGNATGSGYDWVRVVEVLETMNENMESISIRVQPAASPETDTNEITHFFTEEANSVFAVTRESTEVSAAVYGRNEKPNTQAGSVIDKARNTMVAAAAISGFSKLQWKSLVDGILKV